MKAKSPVNWGVQVAGMIFQTRSRNLSYNRDKKRELFRLRKIMDFDKYRNLYPLKLQQGIQKLKYILVKCRLERMIVLFGPLFLGICRGE